MNLNTALSSSEVNALSQNIAGVPGLPVETHLHPSGAILVLVNGARRVFRNEDELHAEASR